MSDPVRPNITEEDDRFLQDLSWGLKCFEHEALCMEGIEKHADYCIEAMGLDLFNEKLNAYRSQNKNN